MKKGINHFDTSKLRFVFKIIALKINNNSPASLRNRFISDSSSSMISFNSSNQYKLSSHSFCAIDILCIKSFLLSAFLASLTFAPTEVADLESCFVTKNSFFIFSNIFTNAQNV